MPGERFEAFVREEFDKLGNSQSRGVAVERVHQADGGCALRVLQSEVNGGRATGIVADGDDLLEPQGLDDRFQIPKLLFEAVVRAIRCVRRAEAQEVYRDGSAPGRRQVWNEVVIDVRVVRKSTQQHEGCPAAWKVADVQAATIARNSMFGEGPDVHVQFGPSLARRPPQTGCGRYQTMVSRFRTQDRPNNLSRLEAHWRGSEPVPNAPILKFLSVDMVRQRFCSLARSEGVWKRCPLWVESRH